MILHECLLIPGEVFNVDKLKKSEERLTNVGYFKCVNVYIAQSNDQLGLECNYRDVHIEVEEQGTGHFGAFFGYSTAEDLFGGISITEKNFNYKGLAAFGVTVFAPYEAAVNTYISRPMSVKRLAAM